jgi:hypothetical protein
MSLESIVTKPGGSPAAERGQVDTGA